MRTRSGQARDTEGPVSNTSPVVVGGGLRYQDDRQGLHDLRRTRGTGRTAGPEKRGGRRPLMEARPSSKTTSDTYPGVHAGAPMREGVNAGPIVLRELSRRLATWDPAVADDSAGVRALKIGCRTARQEEVDGPSPRSQRSSRTSRTPAGVRSRPANRSSAWTRRRRNCWGISTGAVPT